MSALGIRLSVLAGPTVPVPLPADTTARLRSVQVTETDEERSVFTLTLDGGRSGPTGALDAPLLTGSPLGVGARVVLVVTAGVVPTILMDGIVTTVELMPSDEPGGATLRVTGEDVSLLLDRQEKDAEWPALDDYPQVLAILGPYATQGIVPMAIPPTDMDPPLPTERIPTQHGTDLAHLTMLAERHGHVTYMIPGPLPGTSTCYWGPPVRVGLPQPAISVDLGPVTNVVAPPRFRVDSLTVTTVEGSVQDPATGTATPVVATASLRPPLAAAPLWVTQAGALHSTAVARERHRRPPPRWPARRPRWTARSTRWSARASWTAPGTARCSARAAWSGCAAPAGRTTGSGTCAGSSTTWHRARTGSCSPSPARGTARRCRWCST